MKIKKVLTFCSVIILTVSIFTSCDLFTIQPRANPYDPNNEPGISLVLTHQDDFSTDTRNDYEVFYNSNNNGVITYFPGELEFTVSGWNGIGIKYKQFTKFPEYVKAVMKQSNFGDGSSTDYGTFRLAVSEFGNQTSSSWKETFVMNELAFYVYKNKVIIKMKRDDTSNPDAYGTVQ